MDSWEDWGEEMEGSVKLLSTGIDTLLSAFDSFNQNQAEFGNMMDSLNTKMEKQITPKFDGEKLQSAIEKMQKQVDGMNNKFRWLTRVKTTQGTAGSTEQKANQRATGFT